MSAPDTPDQPTDSEDLESLVNDAQQGDREAFRALYRCCVDGVYRYVYKRVENVQVAQDITSMVWLAVVERLHQFDSFGERNFLSWLFTIARNKVVDHYRQTKRKPQPDSFWDEALEHIGLGEDLEVSIERSELLHWAMQQLNEEEQELISLCAAGLTHSQIAQVTGMSSPASVRQKIYRIRKRLTGRLNGEQP